ncbi:DUF6943 family protein [Polaribacter sp.]|uniref:DUF6943 family protein n=1 Tax=Polaribacter sp. TaxID=1920175 RepID=UPI003F6AB9B3
MSTFQIKTHQPGRTYTKPHFFILNKGLNSGKPLDKPCPNCFVITTTTRAERESLYYLCLSLKVGQFFAYYLKGSVIPFIGISDAKKVINIALQNYEAQQCQMKVEKLKKNNSFRRKFATTIVNYFKAKNRFTKIINSKMSFPNDLFYFL